MECYLDNAATTQAYEDVCELVVKVMREDYGNPSSLHMKGVEGEKYVREAADRIAKTLKCQRKNIVFSSGGTESNNTALIGTALANKRRGRRILTTCFEHASVHEPLIYLESMGFQVEYLPVDKQGHLRAETLKEALTEDTILVSVMMVNNEIGSILDVQELAKVVKDFDPQIVFHVDAIQAYGKMKIQPAKWQIDLMSVSGHKIHGPKGTGFLYMKDGTKIHPYIHGGGQQQGMRSGTENVPGIAGLGLAAAKMDASLTERREYLYGLKRYFVKKLEAMEGVTVNGVQGEELEQTAPHIVSASFQGVRSEVLLHALEDKQIYVSSGSACSSNHPGISGTLVAIGVPKELLDSTLRFGFSEFTTKEQLDYTLEQLEKLLPVLRKFTRR